MFWKTNVLQQSFLILLLNSKFHTHITAQGEMQKDRRQC